VPEIAAQLARIVLDCRDVNEFLRAPNPRAFLHCQPMQRLLCQLERLECNRFRNADRLCRGSEKIEAPLD